MLAKAVFVAALCSVIASPCRAADIPGPTDLGAPRSGAAAGIYFRLPLSRSASGRSSPQFGFRLSAVHDYRGARAPAAPVYRADALDFRLSPGSQPALLVGGQPVNRRDRERLNLSTGATIAVAGGGVLLLLLIATVAAGPGLPGCPTIGGSTDHCT